MRRSVEPATWICRQDAPRLPEYANQTSAVSAASPGLSLRRSYQVTPTVPCESTAIAGATICPLASENRLMAYTALILGGYLAISGLVRLI